jgi:hypothetical protein
VGHPLRSIVLPTAPVVPFSQLVDSLVCKGIPAAARPPEPQTCGPLLHCHAGRMSAHTGAYKRSWHSPQARRSRAFSVVYTFTMSIFARGGTAGELGHPETGDLGHPEAAAAGRYRVRSPARRATAVSQAGGKPRKGGPLRARCADAKLAQSSLEPNWGGTYV